MQANSRMTVPLGWLQGRFRAPTPAVSPPITGPVELPIAMALALIVMTMVMAGGLVTAIQSGVTAAGGADRPAVIAGGTLLALPDRLDFEQAAGTHTPGKNIEVTNLGSRPIDLSDVATLDPAGNRSSAYEINADACAGGIPAKGTCVVRVDFVPTAAGNHPATLTIEVDGFSPLPVVLQARAT